MKKTAAKSKGFSAEEKAAMKEYARERAKKGGTGEEDLLAKVAAMPPADRAMATRLHAIMKKHAPHLQPKTWYGMPAYADGEKVICYFQNASKFKARYGMLGFSDKAMLDDGDMWPVAFALMKLGPAEEAKIVALVKKASATA
jgi:uncharacterized protein YdhG (YjbR/CyaY superfamily)